MRPFDEVTQGLAQRILIEVSGADDIEARRLERLGDEPGIVGRGGEGRGLIGGVADDERDALLRGMAGVESHAAARARTARTSCRRGAGAWREPISQ